MQRWLVMENDIENENEPEVKKWVGPRVCPECGGHGYEVCACVPRPEACGDVDEMVGDPHCHECRGAGDKPCGRCEGAGAILVLVEEMANLVAQISARPPTFSWDGAQAKGVSFHGWHMDELLYKLLEDCTANLCEQCQCGGDCIHNAARTVLAMANEPNASAFRLDRGVMQKKVTLIQPKDSQIHHPKDEYTVAQTVNCLEPRVGEILTWKQAQALIDEGVEVTVKGQK